MSWTGLVAGLIAANRTDRVFEKAFAEAFGPGWRDTIDSAWAPQHSGIEWARVFSGSRFRRRGVVRTRDLPYVDDELRRHRLDVWRRVDVGPAAPVLLQIHGGAWMIGSKEQQARPLMYHLAERGWICVAINYRLSPKATWPDHLVDCKLAVKWVREHIAEYGGDPDYVVVTGGSAGGHLAAMVGLTANRPEFQPGFEDVDTSVRAMVPFYGVFDFLDRHGFRRDAGTSFRQIAAHHVLKAHPDEQPDVFAQASPLDQIHRDAPPALVVHGDLDLLAPVEEARLFVERLREVSSAPAVYVELVGAQHAFEMFHSIRALHTVSAVDAFLAWLLSRDGKSTDAAIDTAPANGTTNGRARCRAPRLDAPLGPGRTESVTATPSRANTLGQFCATLRRTRSVKGEPMRSKTFARVLVVMTTLVFVVAACTGSGKDTGGGGR